MEFWALVRLAIVGIVAIVAAATQLIFFLPLTILEPIIGKKRVYYVKSFVMGEYLRFIRFIISDFKLILTGDVDKLAATKDKRCFYIQNHQTELDWIFMSYFLQVFDREADFSAVMKSSLGKIPALGYIVKDLGMCLLDRNWEKDQKHFKDFMEVFENHPRPLCVFMCPEGTTFTEPTYKKSQAYALKTHRPVFEHLLLPHSTGLAFVIKELKQWEKETGQATYLYDTTMQFEGYTGEIPDDNYKRVVDVNYPDPDNSIWKRIPITCHMHINVIPLTSIVSEDATDMETINKQVETWLDRSWMEKERQLEFFTKNQRYDDDWNVNRKIENYNLPKRLRDSYLWILTFVTSWILWIYLFKGIGYLIHLLFFVC